MVTYRHFPYVHEFKDRHGKVRRYFRKPGFKRTSLHGEPGTVEFAEAYQRAADGTVAPKLQTGASRTVPGTVAAACVGYFASTAFKSLAPSTRNTWRNQLEKFRSEHGEKRVAMLKHEHIDRMIAARIATPGTARNFMKALRCLMKHCVANKLRADDPTAAIKLPKMKSGGFHSWTEEDIAKFENRHPIGTKARLALALLLYTIQRRGDVVRMGRQHIRDGFLHIVQSKTKTAVEIPLLPDLMKVLERTKSDHLTFLTTGHGKPFTAAGFGNWFRDRCNEAGLPNGTAAHGLRKAGCRRLAEAGCTTHQIAAWSGHKDIREVARYTEAANRRRLATSAAQTVSEAFSPSGEVRTSSGKPAPKGLPK